MRLVDVIHGPVFGGAHNQALLLAEPLAERGIDTTVVLADEAEPAATRLRGGGVDVATVPLGRLRATADPRRQLGFLKGVRGDLRRLDAVIRERAADVVQVHGVTNPQGALAARRSQTAVLWQLYDTRAPMAARRALMPMVTRLADAMTTWGDALAELHPGASRMGDRRITVFPPVEGGRFRRDEEARSRARAELGVGDEDVVVGSVGVFLPHKGYEYLVRAAAQVVRDAPQVRFRALGAPSPAHADYERRVRAEAAGLGLDEGLLRIEDPGSRVPDLMQAFDIFLLSSPANSEGMPTVILEAMWSGIPVVATDTGAVRELVEQGRTGFVVRPERPEELAAPLLRLASDPGLRTEMGAAGLSSAERRFDLGRLADLHARAFEIAVEHSRRRG